MITREIKLRRLIREGKSHADIKRLMKHWDSSTERVKAIAADKAAWSENKGNMYFDQEPRK